MELLCARVRVDGNSKIVLSKEFREALDAKEEINLS